MDHEHEINLESEDLNLSLDEEEDDLTLEQVIQYMEEAWLNEKFSPEILPHKTEIVEILLGQITQMEQQIADASESTNFTKGIYQMEVDRLRFLVTSYLRFRLEKIETYCAHILEQERARAEKNEDLYCSQNELEFAEEYEQNLDQHLVSTLRFCPDLITKQNVAPNMHSMVFLKSKKNVEGVMIDDGQGENNDLIDLTNGSQVLISYNSVANLVKKGDVHLI